MKKIIFRLTVFSTPFFILLLLFFILDPFMVLRKYDSYEGSFVGHNLGHVSLNHYLRNRKELKIKGYIFGSSRTMGFPADVWKEYTGVPTMSFYSAEESLYGMSKKITFIDSMRDTIQYALLLLDVSVLRQTQDNPRHLNIQPYQITHSSPISYYRTYVNAWFGKLFVIKYLDYRIFHKYRPYMKDAIDLRDHQFDPITNQIKRPGLEKQISTNPNSYIKQYLVRNLTHETTAKPVIGIRQLKLLGTIKAVFDRHETDYKIVIPPVFNQQKINEQDLRVLWTIFGKDHVYDYTGKNKFSDDVLNFYDGGHFRPHVGSEIMKQIYTGE